MIVVGLDLSLTSTGVARVNDGKVAVGRIKPKNISGHDRLQYIVEEVNGWVYEGGRDPDLIVVEGPAYGAKGSAYHQLAGLWWLVTHELWQPGGDWVAITTPAALKTYATGKGNASKDAVLAAVIRRYPNVEVTGNDEADALVLAAMGADHLGEPIAEMPAVHRKALSKVEWPGGEG